MLSFHWMGYQNPETFVWLVLIEQVPEISSNVLEYAPLNKQSRYLELGQSKQAKQKVPVFGIPASVL